MPLAKLVSRSGDRGGLRSWQSANGRLQPDPDGAGGSRSRDPSALAVLAPPKAPRAPFLDVPDAMRIAEDNPVVPPRHLRVLRKARIHPTGCCGHSASAVRCAMRVDRAR